MPHKTYKDYVNSLLDLVRDGLGPYMLAAYKETYPDNYYDKIIVAKGREFPQHCQHDAKNIHALAKHLDAHSALCLALRAPPELQKRFVSNLGNDFEGNLDRLYEQRNACAHETSATVATLEDAISVAEFTVDVLTRIAAVDLAVKATGILEQLSGLYEKQISPEFSPSIRRVHDTIEKLTQQQLLVFKEIGGKSRVAVSGCAGSGKTLLAVEKAIRLDYVGIKTLILCRNPRLATRIREMVADTNIDVFDFNTWIALLTQTQSEPLAEWSQYDEPAEERFLLACERLAQSDELYGAIIIDEAQDFSEDWWVPVEEALAEPKEGRFFYIFFDDNQMLVPRKLKYPVSFSEHPLTQNVRNAGKIFEFVAQYHPQSPAPNDELRNTGYLFSFRLRGFSRTDIHEKIADAFLHSQSYLAPTSLVFITTEEGPSVLVGLKLPANVHWDWQTTLRLYFQGIVQHPQKIGMAGEFTELAHFLKRDETGRITPANWLPNLQQKDFVKRVAQTARERLEKLPPTQSDEFPWDTYSQRQNKTFTIHDRKYLDYFCGDSWWEDLRTRFGFTIGDNIPVYSTSEYKGLEADGVILLIHQPISASWGSSIYVGASRAKYLLCVVSNAENLDH